MGSRPSLVALIEVCRDARRLNQIINHPSVFDAAFGLSARRPVDLSPLLSRADIIAFEGEHGVALCRRYGDIFDCHFAVLPSGRGKWALIAGRAVVAWLFYRKHARALLFTPVAGNIAAIAGARMLGAKEIEVPACMFPTTRGPRPYRCYRLTREDWRFRQFRAQP